MTDIEIMRRKLAAKNPSGYKVVYADKCVCPYCGSDEDVDMEPTWGEEVECFKCNGKFKYDLDITVEFTCSPIDGEGPRDEDGNLVAGPRFVDPNQISMFGR